MCKLFAHPGGGGGGGGGVLDFQKFRGFGTPIGALLWDI